MKNRPLSAEEVALLRKEIELLMAERDRLLQVAGAAAVLVANFDCDSLPEDQDTIDAAEVLAENLNALPEDTFGEALGSVHAEFDAIAQSQIIPLGQMKLPFVGGHARGYERAVPN